MLIILGGLFALFVVVLLDILIKSKKNRVHFYVKPEAEVDLVYTNDESGCRIVVKIDSVWFFSDVYLDEQDAFKDCQRLNKITIINKGE